MFNPALLNSQSPAGRSFEHLQPQDFSKLSDAEYYLASTPVGNITGTTGYLDHKTTLLAYLHGTYFKQGRSIPGTNFRNIGQVETALKDVSTPEQLSNLIGDRVLSDSRAWEKRDEERKESQGLFSNLGAILPAVAIGATFASTVGFGGAVGGAAKAAGAAGKAAGTAGKATGAAATGGSTSLSSIAGKALNAALPGNFGVGTPLVGAGTGAGGLGVAAPFAGFVPSAANQGFLSNILGAIKNNPVSKAINSNPTLKALSTAKSVVGTANTLNTLLNPPDVSAPTFQVVGGGTSSNVPAATSVGGGVGITATSQRAADDQRRAASDADDGIETSPFGVRDKAKTRKKKLLGG